MNFRQIEIFYAIYRSGSISAAARQLRTSQPALSKALKHAESQLGFKLFDRVKQRLIPTHEAELIFAESHQLQKSLNSVNALVDKLGDLSRRTLRIGFLPSLGVGFAPRVLARLAGETSPSCEIYTHHYDQILERLLSHRLDLGVAFSLPQPPGLRSIPVGRMRLVYVEAAGKSAQTVKGPVHLSDVDSKALVGLERESPVGRALEVEFQREGREYAPRISVHTYAVAAACAAKGVGPAIVDEFSAASTPGLNVRPLEPARCFEIVVLLPEDYAASRAETELIDCMLCVCRAEGHALD
ncbi:LysR family transcriptional regulator [Roseovarius spongiae]|uniref:LysR family transcriptional regulator n=1 Tax=Roseovarius spongiae TaxID=2320272 RepID=A0A3A8AVZ7_9RHOB|nr:LysR family transcriptional regulator [Roseovarius spongiae]RKF13582.1 LysR family transcriptional regulator [Roseovarius spongiae]